MDVEDLIEALAELDDLAELRQLRKAVEARMSDVQRVTIQRMVTERWSKLERCKPGTVLYVGGRGTVRIGSTLQTGDSVKVVYVDRDREQMDVRVHRVGGKLRRKLEEATLSARDCHRLQLSRQKPEQGTSALDRTMARNLGKVFE